MVYITECKQQLRTMK